MKTLKEMLWESEVEPHHGMWFQKSPGHRKTFFAGRDGERIVWIFFELAGVIYRLTAHVEEEWGMGDVCRSEAEKQLAEITDEELKDIVKIGAMM